MQRTTCDGLSNEDLLERVKDYYSIESSAIEGQTGTFYVHLNPECEVYEGHFPGTPVSPGVCNIQMVLECAERVAQHHLRMLKLNRCRFTTLLSPQTHPQLEIHIDLLPKEGFYALNATIGKGEEVFQMLKAEILNA